MEKLLNKELNEGQDEDISSNKIYILACGIFQPELEQSLLAIRNAGTYPYEFEVVYLRAGLHSNMKNLKNGIIQSIQTLPVKKTILLYGSKCHPEMEDIVKEYGLTGFPQSNCIELISGHKSDGNDGIFHLTPGWILKWRELFDPGTGIDEVAMRQNSGYFNQALLSDSNTCLIPDEAILEFFDHTQIPIDIENIGLDIFRRNLEAAIEETIKKDK